MGVHISWLPDLNAMAEMRHHLAGFHVILAVGDALQGRLSD